MALASIKSQKWGEYMPSENVSWREELSINIKGGTADEHEIPVDVLMESLAGLQQGDECLRKNQRWLH